MAVRFTIVTLAFNQREFLQRAADSVLAQTGVDLEYIIVDPGSTDGTRQALKQYSTVAKLQLEPDAGPADGLNRAFRRATGDFFGYLNADDELMPGALARAAHQFRQRPSADVLTAHGLIIDREGRPTKRIRSTKMSRRRYAYGIADLMQQASFIRRDAYMRAGGFNTMNRTCWDGELFVDLALSGARFEIVEDMWACFRVYADSITGSQRLAAAFEADQARLFEKVLGRPKHRADVLVTPLARMVKWATDPTTLIWAIQDRAARGRVG